MTYGFRSRPHIWMCQPSMESSCHVINLGVEVPRLIWPLDHKSGRPLISRGYGVPSYRRTHLASRMDCRWSHNDNDMSALICQFVSIGLRGLTWSSWSHPQPIWYKFIELGQGSQVSVLDFAHAVSEFSHSLICNRPSHMHLHLARRWSPREGTVF
jgi:hypothetical protein